MRAYRSSGSYHCLLPLGSILLAPRPSFIGEGCARADVHIVFQGNPIPQVNTAFDGDPVADSCLSFDEGMVANIAVSAHDRPLNYMSKRPYSRPGAHAGTFIN